MSSRSEEEYRQQSSSYPPGSEKVHVDWSEYYDRQSSQATGDEIINVDRSASRHHSIKRRPKNTTTIGAADRDYIVAEYYRRRKSTGSGLSSSAGVDTVDPGCSDDPIIYVSNHSLHSMSTLGTMGLDASNNERSVKKVKSFSTNQEGDHTEQSIVLDHAINERGEEPSAFAPSSKPPAPAPPPPTSPLKRQTSAPEWQQRSSLAASRQDRKVFEQNLLALNQASKNPRPRTKLSPVPQSPYVIEGATPGVTDTPLTFHVSSAPHQHNKQPQNSRSIPTSHPQAQPNLRSFTSSSAAGQTMKDNVQSLTSSAAPQMNDINVHFKSSGKTRVHTGQVPQLPIKAQVTTTVASRASISDNRDSHHKQPVSSSQTRGELAWQDLDRKVFEQNVMALNQISMNPRPIPYKAKTYATASRDVLSENKHSSSETNLRSTLAVQRDPFGENSGGRSQSQQQQHQKKKDDDLLKKIKVGYQNDREKECLPPPPQSPHSVTCAVSPTESEELAPTHSVVKQQSKNAKHPSSNDWSKHNRQDGMKLPIPPFANYTRPIQQQQDNRTTKKTCPTSKGSTSNTMQVDQHNFNTTLMKLQHQVELSKRTNRLAVRKYHVRHFWFYSVPISTCFIMSMILVMMCAMNGLDADERIGLTMGSVFCSILATVFYFLEGKFGMNHHAALHTSARNEMTKAGFQLDQLSKYKGCGLVSGLHSTKACTGAIRSLHRLDMYIQAIHQCTPPTPQGIDDVYKLLNNRINKICRTCPNAIEKRLSYVMDDDNWGGPDQHATMAPFDLVADAYNILEEELRRFILYPVFLPNAEDVVARTIDIFFEDTTEDSDSRSCRNTESISLM